MNSVISIIKAEIKNQMARFVFPSETASAVWAQKACGFTGERSVAAGRFLAWDRFKETAIRANVKDRQPVSAVLRKLFVEKLIRKNAGEKLFSALIPVRFAEEGGVFSRQIAALLPSLALWEERARNAEGYAPDEEDADFAVLKGEYAAFLEARGLFEPSWVKPPLQDREHTYYIFFPEAVEDFTEYEALLKNEKTIHPVRAEKNGGTEEDGGGESLFLYDSSQSEIRAAVREFLRLHEDEGIPYEDMALSVPGLESMESSLMRELRLYNIPARRRWGKPLSEYGAGNIFSLIDSCVANNFSFTALKALLLDSRLPWQDMEANRRLIRFGVENNCVSAYRENGRLIDVWEEAFKSGGGSGGLGQYYRNLKRLLTALTSVQSFGDIRKRFFALYPAYLSREKSGVEGTAVLTRCMEELAGLIQLAQEYPDLVPASPFTFYLAFLKDRQYVPAAQPGGLSVFPYRVAAGAPFAVHFILNAGQDAAAVLYRPLKFLRQDKRGRLGLSDTDASEDFFRLYWQNPPGGKTLVRISAAEKTFAGWTIPHSLFSGKTSRAVIPAEGSGTNDSFTGDPFGKEKAWWAGAETGFPGRLFPVQKQGFMAWFQGLASRPREKFNFLSRAFGTENAFLEERIKKIQWNVSLEDALDREKRDAGGGNSSDKKYLRLSATDMNGFYTCPALWFFRKILSVSAFSLEAKLLDDTSLGNLYHRILEKLFIKIREEDGAFRPAHLEKYFSFIRDCTGDEVRTHPAFQGPLAVPLMVSQAGVITRRLQRLLETEAAKFPDYAVSGCIEKYLGFVKDDMIFVGKIDRVSVSPSGGPVIIDYKTSGMPTGAASRESPDSPLQDFQMVMYVKLYEQEKEQEKQLSVENGYFFSIHRRAILGVFKDPTRDDPCSGREKYQYTLDAFDKYARDFAEAVKKMKFTVQHVPLKTCAACDYKTLCRTAYTLNPPQMDRLDAGNWRGGSHSGSGEEAARGTDY
ncbi:MAG: PD-(D/E)XK nuclease family protein [Spirochaetales bacterium]|jgi:hypothetical protein|nr:PD-(D/E)XK nuclease family protein [Spirochaetales bacterium]